MGAELGQILCGGAVGRQIFGRVSVYRDDVVILSDRLGDARILCRLCRFRCFREKKEQHQDFEDFDLKAKARTWP